MQNLETNFAGLTLRNPIIIGSSGLTSTPVKNLKLYESGAGAIVLKSLFEEQIMQDAYWQGNPVMYPEGSDYLVEYIRANRLEEYLNLVSKSKQLCRIPIIASINCYHNESWVDFAQRIEEVGVDAIEVNVLSLQTATHYTYGSFEQQHIDILRCLKQKVHIPIIMKLGRNLTNPIALIEQLYANGAAGVVLFNRFYQPDIQIDKLTYSACNIFTTEADFPESLRWVAIASDAVPGISYALSGGVHSSQSLIKSLLAGASAVQLCSTIYLHTPYIISEYLRDLEQWMERKGMHSIAQFKGMFNAKKQKELNTFQRTQFLKYHASK